MRRRRRKMSSHPAGRRRTLTVGDRRLGRMTADPLQPLRLIALLMLHLFIMPQLVNLTESSMLSRSESSAPNGSIIKIVPIRDQFDDVPTNDKSVGKNWHRAVQSNENNTTNANPTLSNGSPHKESQINREISALPLVSKQLESSETSNIQHHHQPDDLIALEDSQSSSFIQTHKQRHSASEAPYETGHNLSLNQAEVYHERPSNKTAQLLSIQTVPSLTPIYLKHQLPATLRTPQLVAFPHPASTRGQLDSEGKPVGGDERQQTFALLPSWPNIYITQREQTISPAVASSTSRGPSAHVDPKVPLNYPNWSRTRQETLDRDRLINSEVEYDDHVKAGANSSNSDVEQEDRYGQQQPWTNDESNDELKRRQYRNRSRQLLADSWTKLLEQAAKNNAMESLMLTNRSIVSLLCDKNDMLVKFKFKRPFYGQIETNLDPERRCRLSGNGSQYYELRIDLYECGTRREMSRLFINNIQILFQAQATNRSKALPFAQQEDDSTLSWAADEPNKPPSEFKTLICSYPSQSLRSPTISQTGPLGEDDELSNGQHQWKEGKLLTGVKTSGSESGQSDEIIQQLAPTKGNPFERIVNSERPGEAADRLGSKGSILMAIALLLLTLTIFLLCLIMSVYVGRRKRRLMSEQSLETDRRLATTPKDNNENSLGRLYDLAPAQLANQSGDLVRPVAPPVIGLKLNGRRGRENSGNIRRGANRIDSRRQQQIPIAANPNRLKDKQKEMMVTTRRGNTKRPNSDLGAKTINTSRKKSMPDHYPKSSGGSSDRSVHDRTSSSELSVTTIEIPYVLGGNQQRANSGQTGTIGNQLIRNASSQVPNWPTPTKVDAELQTDLPPAEPQTPPPRERVHEEIKTTSHERIVERTSHLVQEQQVEDGPREIDQKEGEPTRGPSPVPFGSFRAKLTSPNEYRRLNNIVRLFEFDDSRACPGLSPASGHRFDRYRAKLLSVTSPSERAELRRLLNEDETFRSNVVDSTDVETFNRKLRNNRRFPLLKLSGEAWDLFEEILLDKYMSEAQSTSGQTVKSEREFSKLRIESIERKRGSAAAIEQIEPEIGTTPSKVQFDFTTPRVVVRPTPAARPAKDERKSLCDNATTRQSQVSQSNSSHCDGNTTFNFDTVTSISTPTHFSALTRSSFSLKQITKFSEDYPFPYMDE